MQNFTQHLPPLLNRRDVLRVGSLSVAASLLPQFANATRQSDSAKAKSVIYLWMGGGVTHIDSFDPKPNAPDEIRGTLTDIPTNMPGVRFSEVMPNLAKIADQLALIRSFSHDSDDHLLSQVYTLSGRKVDRNGASLGPASLGKRTTTRPRQQLVRTTQPMWRRRFTRRWGSARDISFTIFKVAHAPC